MTAFLLGMASGCALTIGAVAFLRWLESNPEPEWTMSPEDYGDHSDKEPK